MSTNEFLKTVACTQRSVVQIYTIETTQQMLHIISNEGPEMYL